MNVVARAHPAARLPRLRAGRGVDVGRQLARVSVVLGINAVFHDPAAALVVDGVTVAAVEEERFTRRKHGTTTVPFAAWEVPVQAARWCLAEAGLSAEDLDAVAYSYDPPCAPRSRAMTLDRVMEDGWEPMRTLYAQRAPLFLRTALPGLDPGIVRFVPHHVAHAASAYLAAPYDDSAVHDARRPRRADVLPRRARPRRRPRGARAAAAAALARPARTRRSPSTSASGAAATSTR